MTHVRMCRRHRAVCMDKDGEVWCPRGHVVDEGKWDVVRARDGHVAITGGTGMKTVATRKFQDVGGNVLYLRITTGKRSPYLVRVQHSAPGKSGSRTGVLERAGDEATAEEKLDKLADDAIKRGWQEVLGRGDGLAEIPDPSNKPFVPAGAAAAKSRQVRGGGLKAAASR